MPCFLPVLVDGSELWVTSEDETFQVPIDSSEVSCHDEIVSVPSKKQGASALARWPNDLSRETKLSSCNGFNKRYKFSLIDVKDGLETVLG